MGEHGSHVGGLSVVLECVRVIIQHVNFNVCHLHITMRKGEMKAKFPVHNLQFNFNCILA